MIIDVLSDSIKYAFSNPKKLLILGIINLLTIFIIPEFIVEGYEYRITKESLNSAVYEDNAKLPEFNNIKDMFKDGAKLIFIQILYYIIPTLLFISGFMLLIFTNILPYSELLTILLWILSVFLIIFFRIYSFVSIPHAIKYNSIKKAFDFKNINKIIKNIGISNLIIICFILTFIISLFSSWSMCFANDIVSFFNLNETIIISQYFTDFSFNILIYTFICELFFTPFTKVLISRSTGLLYLED